MSEQKLQQHLMFDIETLATVPNAIVLSVGAVLFTKEGIVDKFYVNLSMKEQLDKGEHIEHILNFLENITNFGKFEKFINGKAIEQSKEEATDTCLSSGFFI